MLKDSQAAADPVDGAAAKYNLTQREREVLLGVSKGLSTRELATFLNVSPNTVKTFLRLLMLKMSTNSKAGIIAKIFQHIPVEPQTVSTESSQAERLAS